MLDLSLRLRDELDAGPAAAEACAKLNPRDLAVLVAFAQAVCVRYEQLAPNHLVVVESRVIARV